MEKERIKIFILFLVYIDGVAKQQK